MRIPWIRRRTTDAGDVTRFVPVADGDAVRALFADSQDEPQVLFIHDPYCPISRRAYREMSGLDHDVHIVLTADGPDLSEVVETLSGVRHESPQLIVLQRGKARWSASHYRVRRDAVREAIASLDQDEA